LIICVRDSRMLLGRNLRAVLVMRSLPGAFFLWRLFIIFWVVPRVVNRLDFVILMFCSELECAVISIRSGPGFGCN